MKTWIGSAAVVIKEQQLLMVRMKNSQKWAVPSGEIESGESAEIACIRELYEETGYEGSIIQALHTKKTTIFDYDVTTYYFLCEVVGGALTYHDPDELVEEIKWVPFEGLLQVAHEYPEDIHIIQELITKYA